MSDIAHLKSAIIGDSHAYAYAGSHNAILVNQGITLFSVLRDGLINYVAGPATRYDPITLSLGSVDIRHHVIRNATNAVSMARMYLREVKSIMDEFGITINVCIPVPIEHEERVMSSSNKYRGTYYYGSQYERRVWLDAFTNVILDQDDVKYVAPHEAWYMMPPGEFSETYMEKAKGPHINPLYSRSNHVGWRFPTCS